SEVFFLRRWVFDLHVPVSPRPHRKRPLNGLLRGSRRFSGWSVGLLLPDWLKLYLRGRHRDRVQGRLSPCDFQGHFRIIDDAAVAAEAALVVRRSHVDAIDRARIDAQGAKHALGVVDLEAGDFEALQRRLGFLFLNVNAIDGAGAGALIAADARGKVEAMEAAVA